MQLCRQFLYSLFECRFTAPGTQCAFRLCLAETFPMFSRLPPAENYGHPR